MNALETTNFSDLMKDNEKFMVQVNAAVQNTLRVHKMLGYPVAVWKDGQVAWIPPENIPDYGTANGEAPKLP